MKAEQKKSYAQFFDVIRTNRRSNNTNAGNRRMYYLCYYKLDAVRTYWHKYTLHANMATQMAAHMRVYSSKSGRRKLNTTNKNTCIWSTRVILTLVECVKRKVILLIYLNLDHRREVI